MSKSFTPELNAYFGSEKGAFSPVTKDEFRKSQVTLVGPEQALAERVLSDRLPYNHGSIKAIQEAGHNPEFEFRKFPTGERISLTLSYKTGKPNELRLYLRKDEFKPKPGENWSIFLRDGELWLGHFSAWLETEIAKGSGAVSGREIALETEQDSYQDKINQALPTQKTTTTMAWSRNPQIALEALEGSGYQCEIRPDLETFVSRSSGRPFLEAHHLIPMKIQSEFPTKNLDTVQNICVLSPFAHRKLHHAPFAEILPDLKKLLAPRKQLLDDLMIVEDDVLGMYR